MSLHLTSTDLMRYEAIKRDMTPGMTAVAVTLMHAAFAGRKPPFEMPVEPAPLYCALAHALVTDPSYLESINMAVALHNMIAEVEAEPTPGRYPTQDETHGNPASPSGNYGDLDFPAPNHYDPSKRGLNPK